MTDYAIERMVRNLPHPTSERTATCFHRVCMVVGATHIVFGLLTRSRLFARAHIAIGAAMLVFHGVSQHNHARRDRRAGDYGYLSDWMGV